MCWAQLKTFIKRLGILGHKQRIIVVMKKAALIAFIFLTACNARTSSNSREKKLTKEDSLRLTIIGPWGGPGEDSPVFKITTDSIYYFQHKRSYPYEIVDKDLLIQFPDSKAVLKNIFVVNDTLNFEDEQGLKIKGYRFNVNTK
jgi:hypothetical protein